MNKENRILEATNGGRDIFANILPDLTKFIDSDKKKSFRHPLRDDKYPSASFCYSGGTVLLHDFANDSNMNAIAVYAALYGYDIDTTIDKLASEYNITDDKHTKRKHQNATYSKREAAEGMEDGIYTNPHEFTQGELRLLSPRATAEVCKCWGFQSLSHFSIVKDGVEQTFSSRADYPIYIREAKMIDTEGNITSKVTKMYQPRYRCFKDDDRNYKFSYIETGQSPDSIVNGLYEAYVAKKEEEEKAAADKNYEKKRIMGVICCGERDAVCVASLGYYPIWFNSEGHHITPYEMQLIRKFTDALYYIPDIDKAGKEAMRRNMLAFPYLKIVELPDSLLKQRGDQGKPCKDLRDWCGLNPAYDDFRKLLNTAHSYKIVKYEGAKNGKPVLSADNMRFMLRMNGYYKYMSPDSQTYIYVHVVGKQVEEVSKEQIRNFIVEQTKDYTPAERDAVLGGKALDSNICDIEEIELNFTSATANSQLFFTRNATFLVNKDGIYEVDESQSCHVWKSKVIDREITLMDALFTWCINADSDNPVEITITDIGKGSKLLEFLMRISYINRTKTEKGEPLTEEEICANNRNFASTLFNISYLLHRHREPGDSFAIFFFEHDRLPGIEANGGTGKSIMFEYFLPFMGYQCVRIDAKSDDIIEDKFRYQEVTPQTDIVFYDECHKGFKTSALNTDVSSGIQVEKKHQRKHTIKKKLSPKIACLSNYDPVDYDPSHGRRTRFNPMSHFFHTKDQYGYFEETRQVDDYFGQTLWDEKYSVADSNFDVNAAMQICSYGMAVNYALSQQPKAPMEKVIERVMEENTQGVFGSWASNYFLYDKSHLDTYLVKDSVLADYNRTRQGQNLKSVKSNTLTKELKQWLLLHREMEYNPDDVCTDHQQHRIKKNGTEFIYLRDLKNYKPQEPVSKEGNIAFISNDPGNEPPF